VKSDVCKAFGLWLLRLRWAERPPRRDKFENLGVIYVKILANDASLTRNVINYVVSRQNTDGGYTFVEENDSNAQDTYYALAVLKLLGSPYPRVAKTVEWLRDFGLGSIYSQYYVGKALSLCGEELDDRFRKFVTSTIAAKRHFGYIDVYFEVASEFRATLMTLELADLLDIDPGTDVAQWLLQCMNGDGGFGAHGHSNINSTYYAATSLNLLGFDMKSLKNTVSFLRMCERFYGGFTVVPDSFTPYMEHTYYGVMALDALGENCKFPSQTVNFVRTCQNANGGFARADLGISTFENTFQAVSIIRKLAPE